jgi:spermidine/putrescine transport system ATP-binding protein
MDAQYSIELLGVSKRFGQVQAVARVDMTIRRGEFFSLVGPSGCGKTTLLRMIAGLEAPTEGQVLILGRDMTHVPPHRRPVNTVFQHYALFPHLTVGQNVAFGLRYKDVPRRERNDRVARALDLVRLSGLDARWPSQLSGGQRQRVALARALVLEPEVLLLDEPLGALDQKLRKEMQVELKALQRRLGISFVFVTHDQEEALTMSDRIAVMNLGRTEQVGEGRDVFEHPATEFVAQFMGAANFFQARVDRVEAESLAVRSEAGFTSNVRRNGRAYHPDDAVRFIVRPEKLDLRARALKTQTSMPVVIEDRVYQGISTVWTVRNTSGERFTIYEQNDRPFTEHDSLRVGGKAYACWDWRHGVILHEPDDGAADGARAPVPAIASAASPSPPAASPPPTTGDLFADAEPQQAPSPAAEDQPR